LGNKEELENSEKELEVITEEKIENSQEEILTEEVSKNKEGRFIKFLKRVLGGIIEQVITIALSLILLVVFKFFIELMGYYITQRQQIFLLIYIIVNVLYRPILESTKLGDTIGKKLS
jgi:uncharacterized RDD family membrane protein YckC